MNGVPPDLSERVSEVNVIDIRDVRAQLAGDDSQIEVRLGSQDFGKRLKDALECPGRAPPNTARPVHKLPGSNSRQASDSWVHVWRPRDQR